MLTFEDSDFDDTENDCDDDGLFGCVFGAGVVPQSNILVLLAIFILLSN